MYFLLDGSIVQPITTLYSEVLVVNSTNGMASFSIRYDLSVSDDVRYEVSCDTCMPATATLYGNGGVFKASCSAMGVMHVFRVRVINRCGRSSEVFQDGVLLTCTPDTPGMLHFS